MTHQNALPQLNIGLLKRQKTVTTRYDKENGSSETAFTQMNNPKDTIPAGVELGNRVTVWKVESIMAFMDQASGKGA